MKSGSERVFPCYVDRATCDASAKTTWAAGDGERFEVASCEAIAPAWHCHTMRTAQLESDQCFASAAH